MKKLLVIGLAALLVLGLAAGMASATVTQSNYIHQTGGFVTVTNFANATDVAFINDLQLDHGRLTFSQTIVRPYGTFDNDIVLDSGARNPSADLRIMNFASEQFVPAHNELDPIALAWVAVPGHQEISFYQNVYLGDTDRWRGGSQPYNWSTQQFNMGAGYIRQKVEVQELAGIYCYPDSMDMWYAGGGQGGTMSNTFLPQGLGGRAQLAQTAGVHGDYVLVKQLSNIGGVIGSYETIDFCNWLDTTQIITYW